jgi:hypothetical protein
MPRIDPEVELGLRQAPRPAPVPARNGDDDRYHDEVDEATLNNDRINRAIVITARAAIEKLLSLGWRRSSIRLEIPKDDPLPCWVSLRKRRVFEIRLVPYDDGRIQLQGEWIDATPAPTFLDKFMGH